MWIVYTLLVLIVLITLLPLFLLKPRKRRATAPAPFAHRGLHTDDSRIPENSLAAFQRAAEHGYAVELDVQLTADGQVVVFHDATLTRMCGVDLRIEEHTYAELQKYTLLESTQRIPLLTEVLEVLDGVPVLCEFKTMRSFGNTAICAAAWPILAGYKGSVWIESFNPLLVYWFRNHQPQVVRGILSMRFEKDNKEVTPLQGKLLTALLTNFLTKPDFVAYRLTDHREPAFRLCRWLYRPLTLAWTVRSGDEAAEAENHRFDSVIFEGFLPAEKKFENF